MEITLYFRALQSPKANEVAVCDCHICSTDVLLVYTVNKF
jgi:hypothetical protein